MQNQPLSVASSVAPPQPAVDAIGANRRRHPRFACEGRAEVCVPQGGLLFRGKILDLSLSGCFIATAFLNLERGTPVEVYFVTHQMQFRVAGRIAVLHPKRGAGIAFEALIPRRIRQIQELLKELQPQFKA